MLFSSSEQYALFNFSIYGIIESMLVTNYYGLEFFDSRAHFCHFTGQDYLDQNQLKNSDVFKYYCSNFKKKIVLVDFMTVKDILKNPNKFDYSWADLVIAATTEEVQSDDVEYLLQKKSLFNNENTIFLLTGLNLKNTARWIITHNKKIFFPYHHFLATVVGGNVPVLYTDRMINKRRKYMFEALLGIKRSSRSYIFYNLKENKLLNNSLVSINDAQHDVNNDTIHNELYLLDNWNHVFPDNYRSPTLDIYDNGEDYNIPSSQKSSKKYLKFKEFEYGVTGDSCRYTRLSGLVAEKVYQNSWYSIVSETNISDNGHFITEKTIKALYAKRIFVNFGSPLHLQYLRKLGFQTFDSIIDESYDIERNTTKRFQLAWEQVLWLSKTDPIQIYKKALPIIEHNFNLVNDVKSFMYPAVQFVKKHIDLTLQN